MEKEYEMEILELIGLCLLGCVGGFVLNALCRK